MGAEARPRLVLVVSDLFFEELVPPPGHATLELGCGEGRVCRDLAAPGHLVIGIDAAPTPVAAAREADPGGRYLLADAAALPFGDGEFDLVVAYNSLMDVDAMPGAVREAGRVLEPGGRFCARITRTPSRTTRARSSRPVSSWRRSGSRPTRAPKTTATAGSLRSSGCGH